MKIIIEDMAHNSIDSIFDYLFNYSIRNAIETVEEIYSHIDYLESSPYLGRYIPDFKNYCIF